MDKTLQTTAWRCLPREFKEEVKKEYKVCSEGCRVVLANDSIVRCDSIELFTIVITKNNNLNSNE